MKRLPEFAPYPLAPTPAWSRLWASGAALLTLVITGVVFAVNAGVEWMNDPAGRLLVISGSVGVLVLWLLVFLVSALSYRLNRYNAHCYARTAQQVEQTWWARHRQKAALVEAVLVGAACTAAEHRQRLVDPNHPPPVAQKIGEGTAIRLRQVQGTDIAERERQLAMLLALHWREQQPQPLVLQPVRCYWQGSLAAWAAFVEQVATSCPQVQLPEYPEPWQGIGSLDAIIDQLHGAPAQARILCAGCQSSPLQKDRDLPAGEAAVLWLLGAQGRVCFSRGEFFTADGEELKTVAERAIQQSELQAPPEVCVSFSQADVPDLSAVGWNTRRHQQDAHFAALAGLEAMVVQTLAAWYAEQHGVPCGWLANDPHHTLALGIVEPDDSNN